MKNKLSYPAILTPDLEDNGFVVTFPDLPEAIITKVELARKIQCDEKEVRRLLDPRHTSKLPRLESALQALGYKLVISSQPD